MGSEEGKVTGLSSPAVSVVFHFWSSHCEPAPEGLCVDFVWGVLHHIHPESLLLFEGTNYQILLMHLNINVIITVWAPHRDSLAGWVRIVTVKHYISVCWWTQSKWNRLQQQSTEENSPGFCFRNRSHIHHSLTAELQRQTGEPRFFTGSGPRPGRLVPDSNLCNLSRCSFTGWEAMI